MLSATSKYALRVLVALDGAPPDQFIPGRTLAEHTWIPSNYLSKVLLALRNAEIVETVRGQHGGYRLARDSEGIRLIDVVEVFEGFRSHPSCLLGVHTECSDKNPCSAHASFRDVRSMYIKFLEETSIAEVARMEKPGLASIGGSDTEPSRRQA